MSQHDLVVDNGPGINVRLDLNQAIQALGTLGLGTVSPVPTYPCQRWADQTTGLMKKRNTANTAWLADGKLDVATGGGVPVGGAAGAILVKNSASDGDMVWSTASYFPASGGTLSGSLVVAGNLAVNGSSTFNNPVQVNSTLVSSVNIQCNVAAGQNALYWSNVAGVRQWYAGCISNGSYYITDQSAGAVRLQIDTAGNVTVPVKLWIGGQDGCEINVPAGQYARYRSTVAGARTWDMGTYASGIFSIDDITAGVSRLSINTAGLVTVQALSVIGALTIANLNTNAITATSIIASANIQCNPGSGAAWFYATAPGVRQWQWGVQTDGTFWIYDTSAARRGLRIDTAGNTLIDGTLTADTLSVSGALTAGGVLTANGGIQVAGNGITYNQFDTDRIAIRWISLSNFGIFINGSNVGAFYTLASDERYKRNIKGREGDALEELKRIRIIRYDSHAPESPDSHVTMGFSAQQIEPIIPEAVVKSPLHGRDAPSDEMLLTVHPTPLLTRCIAAIQQLASRIETLEGR